MQLNYFLPNLSAIFQLIAVTNPILCGWRNDPQKAYGYVPAVFTTYEKRIPGPLLDPIDIQIEVSRVNYEKPCVDRLSVTSDMMSVAMAR